MYFILRKTFRYHHIKIRLMPTVWRTVQECSQWKRWIDGVCVQRLHERLGVYYLTLVDCAKNARKVIFMLVKCRAILAPCFSSGNMSCHPSRPKESKHGRPGCQESYLFVQLSPADKEDFQLPQFHHCQQLSAKCNSQFLLSFLLVIWDKRVKSIPCPQLYISSCVHKVPQSSPWLKKPLGCLYEAPQRNFFHQHA